MVSFNNSYLNFSYGQISIGSSVSFAESIVVCGPGAYVTFLSKANNFIGCLCKVVGPVTAKCSISGPAVFGIVVGCILFLVLIIVTVVFIRKRLKKRNEYDRLWHVLKSSRVSIKKEEINEIRIFSRFFCLEEGQNRMLVGERKRRGFCWMLTSLVRKIKGFGRLVVEEGWQR